MKSLRRHRDRLPVLGCWPQRWVRDDAVWHMFELQLKPDGNVDWYLRRDDVAHGGYGSITYRDHDTAVTEAKSTNLLLKDAVNNLALPFQQAESIRLKVQKALTAEERLMDEERVMLMEAIKRHGAEPRPRLEDLTIAPALGVGLGQEWPQQRLGHLRVSDVKQLGGFLRASRSRQRSEALLKTGHV